MSKADHAFSTPASASKSRRDVILGAGGIVAASALSSAALALPAVVATGGEPSDTFATALRIARLRWDAHGAAASCNDDSPEQQHYDGLASDYEDALLELFDHLVAKPVISMPDLAALAVLARAWEADDPNPDTIEADIAATDDPRDCATLQLMAAAIRMAKGGANVLTITLQPRNGPGAKRPSAPSLAAWASCSISATLRSAATSLIANRRQTVCSSSPSQ